MIHEGTVHAATLELNDAFASVTAGVKQVHGFNDYHKGCAVFTIVVGKGVALPRKSVEHVMSALADRLGVHRSQIEYRVEVEGLAR